MWLFLVENSRQRAPAMLQSASATDVRKDVHHGVAVFHVAAGFPE